MTDFLTNVMFIFFFVGCISAIFVILCAIADVWIDKKSWRDL